MDGELMDVIWTLEATVAQTIKAAPLLALIENGPLLVSLTNGGILPDPLPERYPLRTTDGIDGEPTVIAMPETIEV
jgi:hypothetical protein